MSDIDLSQTEADALIALAKIKVDDELWDYPAMGGNIAIPLTSVDQRTNFILDIGRGRIDLLKGRYQNRVHQAVPLVRLDFGGAPHRNPDGVEISCPHLHVFRQGFGLKWAFRVPAHFQNLQDNWQTLQDFMTYCNVTQPPSIRQGLFA